MPKKDNNHRQRSWWEKDDPDPPTDRSIVARITEAIILFSVACFVLKLAVEGIVSIRVPLIVIGSCILILYIIYRIHKRRRYEKY